jgi:hypothetical protein
MLFFDILEEENLKKVTEYKTQESGFKKGFLKCRRPAVHAQKVHSGKKVRKGARGMPWLSEAKKDVISCEKLRGLANTG